MGLLTTDKEEVVIDFIKKIPKKYRKAKKISAYFTITDDMLRVCVKLL